MSGPLGGVRVVDLTTMLAGPYATMLLADLGADVVKVEAPSGDLMRWSGPFRPEDGPEGLGGYFQSVNRGKRGVVIDLKTDDGRAQLVDLVRVCDVVVENYSAGVMDRLGVGYEVLREANPRLVYGAIRGFGDTRTGASPYVDWPAFDVVAQAMGGLLSITGPQGGGPVKTGPGVGDIFPASLLVVGVLAALRHAERTGEGQWVDVAMYDAVLSLCERIVYQHSYTGAIPGRQGNSHPFLCPFDVFPTADGWVALAALGDRQWALVASAIDRPDMATDERYATVASRGRHHEEVRAAIVGWLSTRTTVEVMAAIGGIVPAGPVNDVAAIFADPHVAARNMLVPVDQPGSDRPVVVAGQPIKFTATPTAPPTRAPLLGESTVAAVVAGWATPPGTGSQQTPPETGGRR